MYWYILNFHIFIKKWNKSENLSVQTCSNPAWCQAACRTPPFDWAHLQSITSWLWWLKKKQLSGKVNRDDLWWFMMVYDGLWWFLMVYDIGLAVYHIKLRALKPENSLDAPTRLTIKSLDSSILQFCCTGTPFLARTDIDHRWPISISCIQPGLIQQIRKGSEGSA
jgi:hypothetical protein